MLALLVHVGLSSCTTLYQISVFLRGTVSSRLRLCRRYGILLLRLGILSFGGDHSLVHGTTSSQIIAHITIILGELQMTELRELCDLLGLILKDKIAETYLLLVVALVNIFWTCARHLLIIILTHYIFY